MKKLMLLPALRTLVVRYFEMRANILRSSAEHLKNVDLLTSFEKGIIARNSKFKDLHKGQRAFAIVNGPSLKKQDLSLLKNEITFTVNGFWKHPVVEKWQPTYHSLIDPQFFNNEQSTNDFWHDLNRKIPASTLFLPLLRGYEANKKFNFATRNNVYYIASSGDPCPSVDLTKLVQGFQSVSACILAQAIYMGCNPIYLLGYDHDYLAYRGIDHHFYEGGTIKGNKNEFVPFSDISTYEYEMKSMLALWANYTSLKKVADKREINIYNATEGGYLDVFKRVSYTSIF